MALSRVQYEQQQAGQQVFIVPFPYLQQQDVMVSVDGQTAAFTWNSQTQIHLTTAPDLGAIIDITR